MQDLQTLLTNKEYQTLLTLLSDLSANCPEYYGANLDFRGLEPNHRKALNHFQMSKIFAWYCTTAETRDASKKLINKEISLLDHHISQWQEYAKKLSPINCSIPGYQPLTADSHNPLASEPYAIDALGMNHEDATGALFFTGADL